MNQWPRNVSKEFQKDIIKPEAKILKSLVNCAHTNAQTDRQTLRLTGLDLEWTPLLVGSAKNKVCILVCLIQATVWSEIVSCD